MSDSWFDLRILFVFLHIMGTVIGAGAAFTGDILFITRVRNKELTSAEIQVMHLIGNIVWIGLILASISGVGLVLLRPEIFLFSEKLWAKLSILGIIIVNGLVFLRIHRPTFEKSAGKSFTKTSPIIKQRKWILLSGGISVVSWLSVILLGVLGRTPFTYMQFLSVYLVLLVISCSSSLLLRDFILSPKK